MARKPTVSTDSVAGDQLRAFFERIERLDEELRSINDDKKEVFAEAKGNGFDTKAMKIILKERRQDASERMETEALVELYRAALGMAAAPYDWGGDDDEAETGTRNANVQAHARTDFGEELRSEITDEDRADPQKLYAAALRIVTETGKAGPALLQRRLIIGYNKACNLIERMEAEGVVSKPNAAGLRTVIKPSSSDPGVAAKAEGSTPNPQPDPSATIQPSESTATQSTAPRSDVGDNSTEGPGHGQPLDPVAATTPPAGETPPVDTNSEPDQGKQGGKPGTAPMPAGGADAASPVAPVKVPRPDGCLNPDVCASSSWHHLCHQCSKALTANVALVGLTIGAADIPHEGPVA